MTESEFKKLAKAVNRWLSFQILCGREMLLSEGYLCQPIAEFLLQHHNGSLETEYVHPQLNQVQRGRPRQVDFVLLSPETRAVDVAIECKWIAGRQYSKQAIVDDLLRLECIRQDGRHVRRYFLVAGRQAQFFENFADVEMNSGGERKPFAKHLLAFDIEDREVSVDLLECEEFRRKYYKEFSDSYSVELPRGFNTRLISKRDNDSIAVFLWKVESRRNRRTFDPGEMNWE